MDYFPTWETVNCMFSVQEDGASTTIVQLAPTLIAGINDVAMIETLVEQRMTTGHQQICFSGRKMLGLPKQQQRKQEVLTVI